MTTCKTLMNKVKEGVEQYRIFKQRKRLIRAQEELNILYPELKLLCLMLINAKYHTRIQNIKDRDTVAHIIAVDIITKLFLDEIDSISGNYLNQFIKPYIPGYQYCLTDSELDNRVQIIRYKNKNYTEGDDKRKRHVKKQVEFVDAYENEEALIDHNMQFEKMLEAKNIVDKTVDAIYRIVIKNAPLTDRQSVMLSNLFILVRVKNINIVSFTSLLHYDLIILLYAMMLSLLNEISEEAQ